MDWWKLFSSTFILILLAELGDKTQLAALAKTADSPGSSAKWIVFLGASLALVASTFIAVFLGNTLKSLIPDERYIKLAAATLFLVFGFMILYETHRSFKTEKAPAPSAAAPTDADPGLIGGIALRAAMDFESFAGERYRRLAASAPPRLAALLRELANEEDMHLARLQHLPEQNGMTEMEQPVPTDEVLPGEMEAGAATLRDLIQHEEATAGFYQALADRTVIPSVRGIFAKLAEEERGHATRLAAVGASVRLLP